MDPGRWSSRSRSICLEPATVEVPIVHVPDAVYVVAIGLSHQFRGYELEDGTRLGWYLLDGAIGEMREASGGSQAPPVWAYVHPENAKSHAMFTASGFGRIPPRKPGAEEKRYRRREV